ncbi:MAG: TlpA disulfide reductase family protein [Vicinamibacterales bacterium]
MRLRLTLMIALVAVAAVVSTGATEHGEQKLANLDLTFQDLNGKSVALRDFRGKVIILNLWATWCGPCRAEIPDLVALQAAYPHDLAVVGVVIEDKFSDNVKAFAKKFGIDYPLLNGNDRQDFVNAYGPFWGLPASFVIDRHGKLIKKHQGSARRKQFESEVRPLF